MATICAGGVARQRCSRWTRISAREELPGLSTLRIWLTWSFCPPIDSVAGVWVGQPGRPRRRFASGSRLPGRWRPSPRSSGCSCGRCNATRVCSSVFMLICCSTPVNSERIRDCPAAHLTRPHHSSRCRPTGPRTASPQSGSAAPRSGAKGAPPVLGAAGLGGNAAAGSIVNLTPWVQAPGHLGQEEKI